MCEMMGVITDLIVVIISQYINVLDHHFVYIKLKKYINSISVKGENKSQELFQ